MYVIKSTIDRNTYGGPYDADSLEELAERLIVEIRRTWGEEADLVLPPHFYTDDCRSLRYHLDPFVRKFWDEGPIPSEPEVTGETVVELAAALWNGDAYHHDGISLVTLSAVDRTRPMLSQCPQAPELSDQP